VVDLSSLFVQNDTLETSEPLFCPNDLNVRVGRDPNKKQRGERNLGVTFPSGVKTRRLKSIYSL